MYVVIFKCENTTIVDGVNGQEFKEIIKQFEQGTLTRKLHKVKELYYIKPEQIRSKK